MCNKNSPTHPSPSDTQTKKYTNMRKKKIRKQTTKDDTSSSTTSSLKPLRQRNRTKTRKPKYFSLRLQLSESQPKKTKMTPQQQQLNLFPLHPENTVDMHEENNVALLFSSDGGATLTGLLEDESTTTVTTTTAAASEEASFSPPAVDDDGDEGRWLIKKAMRRREVGEGMMSEEERWVLYSEVTSGGGGGGTTPYGSLSLKLDHEGILNAWSDKRSLYVAGEAPQTVPDLHNDVFLYNALPPNIGCDGWSSDAIGNTWSVPEICGANNMKMKEEIMGWKLGQREASVQRYKEKRQNRLFSKRIRYEVRKLNAEKRPRMKGRFVKRE